MDKTGAPDFANWSCPLPLVGYPTIVMGHGGGGKLGNELVEHLFLPAFRNPALEDLGAALDQVADRGMVGPAELQREAPHPADVDVVRQAVALAVVDSAAAAPGTALTAGNLTCRTTALPFLPTPAPLPPTTEDPPPGV